MVWVSRHSDEGSACLLLYTHASRIAILSGETELVLVTVFCAVPNSFCGSAQCSNKHYFLRLIHIQILTYYPISANLYLEYSVFKCNVIANHLPSLFPYNIYLGFTNKCQFAILLSHLCSMIVHKTQWTGFSRAFSYDRLKANQR